jgi:drug/metabolite transporter (DMT)-like permease
LVFLFLTFCVGALAMAPFATAELVVKPIEFDASVIGTFVYLGTFPSVVAYFLYNNAVVRLGPGTAGQAINLMPIFGALLAATILGEELHAYHGLGIAAILGGIALTSCFAARPAR